MKRIIIGIMLILAACGSASAAEATDTIAFNGKVLSIITEENTNVKTGKVSIKYFAIYEIAGKKQMCQITKSFNDAWLRCQKHQIDLAIDAIVSKKTKQIKKLILGLS